MKKLIINLIPLNSIDKIDKLLCFIFIFNFKLKHVLCNLYLTIKLPSLQSKICVHT